MTSFGPGGYPDGQRVQNWDGPILWNHDTGPTTTDVTSPVMDVSRFAYLCGNLSASQGNPDIIIDWYLDSAATIPVGGRSFAMSVNVGGGAQLRIPNLGPYVQITLAQAIVGTYRVVAYIFATNRVYALDFLPGGPLLIDQQDVTLGAGATAVLYPTGYYAGPVQIWTDIAAPSLLSMQALVAGSGWDYIAQQSAPSTPSQVVYEWVAPSGAWRINFTNTGSSPAGYYLAVIPSLTGST